MQNTPLSVLPRRALLLGAPALAAALALGLPATARAAGETPDAWIGRLSQEVLQTIKADKAMQLGQF